jgi:hypothetical protein
MNEFRRLIAGPEPIYAPLVFNPVSALLAQAAGFRALYLGGGSMGYIKAGTEANLSVTEMAQAALDIRTVCPLPLILDGAGGWGDPMHVRRTITASEAAGFAAIEIEDQLLPKRAHHHIGIEHMIPPELMEAKIRAAVAARRDPDFVIIGRTNALRSAGLDEALRRAEGLQAGRRRHALRGRAPAGGCPGHRRTPAAALDVHGRRRRASGRADQPRRAGGARLPADRRSDDAVHGDAFRAAPLLRGARR